MLISLSKEERRKFGMWLEQEGNVENGIAAEMERLKIPTANHYRSKAAMKLIISKEILSIEEF